MPNRIEDIEAAKDGLDSSKAFTAVPSRASMPLIELPQHLAALLRSREEGVALGEVAP
jgi:hypothetical protein